MKIFNKVSQFWILILLVVLFCLITPAGGFHRIRSTHDDHLQGIRRFPGLKTIRKGLKNSGGVRVKSLHHRRTRTDVQIDPDQLHDLTSSTTMVNEVDVTGGSDASAATDSKKQMVWLNFTEANREILQLIHKKYGYKNEKLMIKKRTKMDKNQQRQKTCHSIAMLQCGCNALTSFQTQLNASDIMDFSKKCEIREKFFKCLDNAATAACRHSNRRLVKPKSAFKQRMREIVRVLWTTRGCILGTDDSSQSLKDLNINSRFCSSFHHHHHHHHHHHSAAKRSRTSTAGGSLKKNRRQQRKNKEKSKSKKLLKKSTSQVKS